MLTAIPKIDNREVCGSLSSVSRARKSFAVFMTALWLLATQHCGLEAVGILVQQCQQEDGSRGCGGTEHAGDGCEIVEGGGYKVNNGAANIVAPQLVACACLICLNSAELRLVQVAELSPRDDFERPRDWVPTWQFERRAAAPAHAPDSFVA